MQFLISLICSLLACASCLTLKPKEDCAADYKPHPLTKPKIYSECGSACPKRCNDTSEPKACIMICVSGCFCPKDYLLNSVGDCVKKENCDKITRSPPKVKCDADYKYHPLTKPKEFNECGSSCPPKCNSTGTQICTKECRQGCFCPSGYLLNSAGDCVQQEDCNKIIRDPEQCLELPKFPLPAIAGKEYSGCASPCPTTCEDPKAPVCNFLVCNPGWACPNGYLVNSANQCIRKDLCPQTSNFPGYDFNFPKLPGFPKIPFKSFSDFELVDPFSQSNQFGQLNIPDNRPTFNSPIARRRPPTLQIVPGSINTEENQGEEARITPTVVRVIDDDHDSGKLESGQNANINEAEAIEVPKVVNRMQPLIDLNPSVPRPTDLEQKHE